MIDKGTPLLTIIVPTYNATLDIELALHSIFTQQFDNFEVVIVDGLSTDNTIKKINVLYGNDQRLSIYQSKDNGIYDAMNKGIYHARGDWVYFMGADDTLFDENVLSNIAMQLKSENDIVYGDSLWVPENIRETGEWNYETFIKANINHQRIFYRKSVFEKYGYLNAKYKIASDHEMNIRFFCNSNIRKKYVPITIANFHSGGFSAKKTDEVFWEDWDEIILKNFKPYLPKKIIYGTLGTYIRYLADKKKYTRAMALLCKHFYHTRSFGFIKLMLDYFSSSKTNYAS